MDPEILCDFCHRLVDVWVDGKTTLGPWANMCLACFRVAGIGLGTGKGQKYVRGVKVEG
jgi:hypothetical protein